MKEKLKPCPFCGGKAHISQKDKMLYCDNCEVCMGGGLFALPLKEAVKAWNTRQPIENKV